MTTLKTEKQHLFNNNRNILFTIPSSYFINKHGNKYNMICFRCKAVMYNYWETFASYFQSLYIHVIYFIQI